MVDREATRQRCAEITTEGRRATPEVRKADAAEGSPAVNRLPIRGRQAVIGVNWLIWRSHVVFSEPAVNGDRKIREQEKGRHITLRRGRGTREGRGREEETRSERRKRGMRKGWKPQNRGR